MFVCVLSQLKPSGLSILSCEKTENVNSSCTKKLVEGQPLCDASMNNVIVFPVRTMRRTKAWLRCVLW